jgi:hypothetical protein
MLQSFLLSVMLAMIALFSGPPIIRVVLLLLALIVLLGGAVSTHE